MTTEMNPETGNCLNCGRLVNGRYCSHCGQKFQPTKVPLRVYLEDTVESLFQIDNRVFRTLRDIFLYPGKVTRDYIAGKRARYLPPLRIYLSMSLLYFLVIALVESKEILFANINIGKSTAPLIEFMQYAMIFLIPAFAFVVQLVHRSKKMYYVEHLILSMHLHVAWFFFFAAGAVLQYYLPLMPQGSPIVYIIAAIQALTKISVLVYLYKYLKSVYQRTWYRTLLDSFLVIFGYALCFALVLAIYTLFNLSFE